MTTILPRSGAIHSAGHEVASHSFRHEWLPGSDRRGRLETIAGITCARLNTPGGFAGPALEILQRCAERGGLGVVYGHPHSLRAGDSWKQSEMWLVPFLREVQRLREAGLIRVCLPRELIVDN